jgi:hypothetical protein
MAWRRGGQLTVRCAIDVAGPPQGGGERASSPLAVPQVAASTRFPSLLGTRARIYSTPVALARPPTKRNAVPVPHLHVGPPLVLPNPSRQCSTWHIYPG